MNLAPYACHHNQSKGRQYKETKSLIRNDFQRDRDRIIHSASFRRLQYKTQVFVNHEGDMFRSRLTHSLEVSQIARGIARSLDCHEDLVEAIALAHDLGHTPFGHAGQDALNECMREHGGFEHNLQSLRVVDILEKKYAEFDGLNLSFEIREGILKHCSIKNAKKLGDIGLRFLNRTQPSIEAQIVNVADEIAYSHHDLDDGYRSGILNFDLLKEIDLFNHTFLKVKGIYGSLNNEQLLNETLRRMMNLMIDDLCCETKKKINDCEISNINDVRNSDPLVKFSFSMNEHLLQIRKFSKSYLYQHPRIKKMGHEAEKKIKLIFEYFLNFYEKLPLNTKNPHDLSKERIIADYIAGMTDRFACDFANKI